MKKKEKRKTYLVGIDRQFSPEPRYITSAERQVLHPLKPNVFTKKTFQELEEDDEFIPITQRDHVIQNVTVKAKRRYFTNDDWRYKNEAYGRQNATIHYNIDRELDNILDKGEPEQTIFEFLARNNKMFDNLECKDLPKVPNDIQTDTEDVDLIGVHLRDLPRDGLSGQMSYGHRPIKWIVENGANSVVLNLNDPIVYDQVKRILGTPPNVFENEQHEPLAGVSGNKGVVFHNMFPWWMSDIKSLYIVPDSPQETDMAVRIYLYCHHMFTTESNKGIRRTYFQGFNKASTFKTEDYNVIPPMADFRRTIWWQPDITTDEQGKAKVEFFNNSTCEEMYISVEGMTEDGKVLVNE